MNDDVRLLIMATLTSLFPVLGILGVTNFTADEQNVILLFVGNLVLLGARAFKKGQQPGPA